MNLHDLAARFAARLKLFAAIAGLVVSGAVILSFGALAQQSIPSVPNISPDQLQDLLRRAPGSTQVPPTVDLNPTVLRPAPAVNAGDIGSSRLEQIMSARAGTRLQQFGYDQFGNPGIITVPQTGALQDDYVLGAGDELDISLRGQENSQQRITIDRNGQVLLPRLAPVAAAGRTLGEFRRTLSDTVARSYVATQAFVTVGRLRQISVLVSGEVNNPGQRLMSALMTPADAILISGGVRKTGSLRSVKLIRAGRQTTIDLYSILTGSVGGRSVHLSDGDRIVVSPLGRTVAVAGWVRRPGIYELASGQSGISARALMTLAGGMEVRGAYRWSVLRIGNDGSNDLVPLENDLGLVRDSEILFAQPGASQSTGQATLSGGSPLAGGYSVTAGATRLSDVIRRPGALGDTPYSLFGIVSRRDASTQLRTLIPFAPSAVMRGAADIPLQSNGDIVRVFTQDEAKLLVYIMQLYTDRLQQIEDGLRDPLSISAAEDAASANKPRTARALIDELSVMVLPDTTNPKPPVVPVSSPAPGSVPLQQNVVPPQSSPSAFAQPYWENGQNVLPMSQQQLAAPQKPLPANYQEQNVAPGQIASNVEAKTFGQVARQLNIDSLVLMNFIMDQAVSLNGPVRGPGVYLVGPNVQLPDVVTAAGGMLDRADSNDIEVLTTVADAATGMNAQRQRIPLDQAGYASYVVRPKDQIRLKQRYDDAGIAITIQGQVRNPGTFQIRRGERLSEVLARAGGLTNVAYPYGAVFLRKSAAITEQQGYEREAKEVEKQLMLGLTRNEAPQSSTDVAASLRFMVETLRSQKALGRISVQADPAVLATKPETDLLLEPGDVLFIPQRPTTVAVIGEVMSPASFISSANMSVDDYISSAGGYSRFADKSLTFVVLPDGSARKIETSWLDLNADALPPGSTIVVPRDMMPFNWGDFLGRATQIVSQLAVSAASLVVLTKN